MSMRTAIRSATGVAVVVLAGVLVWHLTHQPKSVLGAVAKHKIVPAPNFTLDRLNGSGKLTFASLRGKAVVVNFWASWCGPCKQEMPRLVSFSNRWSGHPVVVVGIDIGEIHKGPGQSFSRHYGATYPMVFDPSASTSSTWGILGTPQTFFVDRRGRIVDAISGPVSDAELTSGIRTALKT